MNSLPQVKPLLEFACKKTFLGGAAFVVALLLALAAGACSDQKTLVIATSTDYPPFSYVDAQGGPAGFDYEYGQLLCDAMDARCVWETRPFEEIFNLTADGEFDLAVNSFTRTKPREQLALFSNPYYRSYGQFATRAGSGVGLETAATVAVQAGTIYERLLHTEAYAYLTKIIFPDQVQAFQAVGRGEADLTIADDVLIDLLVNQSPHLWRSDWGTFERVGEPLVPVPGTPEFEALGAGEIGIVLPKSNADLLEEVNRAIEEVNGMEEIADLSISYFGRNIVSRE